MSEFIDAMLSPVNLVLTVMLVFCLGYWLLVAFGSVALDSLDIELDTDLDTDGGFGGGSIALGVGKFLNVGEVPLMILLSIYLLVLWLVGMFAHPWVGGWGVILQVLALVPMGIVAALVTKLLTQPLASVFRKMREDEEAERHLNLVGMRGRVISGEVNDRYGQIEVETTGNPVKLNARIATGDASVLKGREVVIVSEQEEDNTYIVRGF
ncbi:MAG: hypothetical protein AAGC44_02375 [Planctomycetota bacterium]